MTQRLRVVVAALFLSFFFTACDYQANNDASMNQNVTEVAEITLSENAIQESDEGTTETESTVQENGQTAKEVEEAMGEEVNTLAEAEETMADVVEAELVTEEIDPILQVALQELIQVTEFDKESYSFTFEQTDEYVQVEVREKEEDVAPLVGIYRYMLENGEILYSDYLTGDFVPFN